MFKIAFLITTKDRPEAIVENVKKNIEWLERNCCAIYIADGSELKNSMILTLDNKNLFYYHMPGKNIGERCAFLINTSDSEYICISGDTKIINVEVIEDVLQKVQKGYTLIDYYGIDYLNSKIKEYSSVEDMYKERGWESILYSTFFVRKIDYFDFDFSRFTKIYGENCFFYLYYYFSLLNNNCFKGIYIPKFIYSEYSSNKTSWFWNKDIFFKVWCEQLFAVVDSLPESFESMKDDLLIMQGRYGLRLDKPIGIIRMRMNSCFDLTLYKKYKKDLLRLGNRNSNFVCMIISITPKILCKMFYISYWKLAKIKRMLRNRK